MKIVETSLVFAICWTTPSLALTQAEWQNAGDEFRTGYVWGITDALTSYATSKEDNERADGYLRCFTDYKIDSNTALRIVKDHLAHTSDAAATSMAGNVLEAFFNACRRYVDPK